MFSLPLPLPDPLLSHPLSVFFLPPIPTPCLYFTRPCSSILPGNKMGQESVQFERGHVSGTVNHFYCSLTLASPLFLCPSARETLFQQMGETDITINLFFEKERRTSNVICHICFIVQRVCSQRCFAGFVCLVYVFLCICAWVCMLMFVWWNRWCSDLCVRLRNLRMSLLAWRSVNTQCYTERIIQIWWEMLKAVNTDQEQICIIPSLFRSIVYI